VQLTSKKPPAPCLWREHTPTPHELASSSTWERRGFLCLRRHAGPGETSNGSLQDKAVSPKESRKPFRRTTALLVHPSAIGPLLRLHGASTAFSNPRPTGRGWSRSPIRWSRSSSTVTRRIRWGAQLARRPLANPSQARSLKDPSADPGPSRRHPRDPARKAVSPKAACKPFPSEVPEGSSCPVDHRRRKRLRWSWNASPQLVLRPAEGFGMTIKTCRAGSSHPSYVSPGRDP